MDLSKLSQNQKIAGGAGALLVINLFLPWYGFSIGGFGASISAFNSGFLAWGGSLVAIAATVIIVLKALDIQDISAGDIGSEKLAAILAAVGGALILLRFLTQTSFTKIGLFVGIIASAAGTYAAYKNALDAGVEMPNIPGMSGGDE